MRYTGTLRWHICSASFFSLSMVSAPGDWLADGDAAKEPSLLRAFFFAFFPNFPPLVRFITGTSEVPLGAQGGHRQTCDNFSPTIADFQ